ncbi:tyrosine-type recombinase/integrase [Portibacter marinus]|uniref:tyrosine-type recombinase/integrase n=1 Tax=Portibacter marinus TaxID=2898660 RepID=UPI0038730EB8
MHSLRASQINFSERLLTINTLKRRRNDIYRQMPLPDHLLADLKTMITHKQTTKEIEEATDQLWSFSRRTAARVITSLMENIGIEGARASALGLRHGFAVYAVTKVPLTQVKKWMGHAYMTTTALYLEVSGIEERKWAEKLWE